MSEFLEVVQIGPGPLIALLVLASLGLTLTRATHIEGNQPLMKRCEMPQQDITTK